MRLGLRLLFPFRPVAALAPCDVDPLPIPFRFASTYRFRADGRFFGFLRPLLAILIFPTFPNRQYSTQSPSIDNDSRDRLR